MEVMVDWAKNLTFFMIFMNLAYQLMPEGNLQKYSKLLGSFLLLLLLMEPVMGFFSFKDNLSDMVEQAQQEMEDEVWKNWQDNTIQKNVKQRQLQSELTYLLGLDDCEVKTCEWDWEEGKEEWSVCGVSVHVHVERAIWENKQEVWREAIATLCRLEGESVELVLD